MTFKWAGGGCIGLGGPGNAWTNPLNNYKVGTINISRTGAFTVKNVKSTFRGKQGAQVVTKVTTSTVTGRFKSATTATGTISFTQKLTKTCAGKVTFTATLGPALGALHKLSPASGTSVTSSTPTLQLERQRECDRLPVLRRHERERRVHRRLGLHGREHPREHQCACARQLLLAGDRIKRPRNGRRR